MEACTNRIHGVGMKPYLVLVFMIFTILASSGPAAGESRSNQEIRLLQNLHRNSIKNARPVSRASDSVHVTVMFFLIKIVDVDEKAGVISTYGWLHQEWTDENLKWNPDDYDGISAIRVPVVDVWTPKIVLANTAESRMNLPSDDLVRLHSNGRVTWQPQQHLKSFCPIDLRKFPVDTQYCTIRFGSWFYTTKEVNYTDIQLKTTDPSRLSTIDSPGWAITKLTVKRKVISYSGEYYSEMVIGITMDRKSGYHQNLFVLPAVLFSLLTAAIFLLPPESGERITLGVGIILGITILLAMLESYLPMEMSNFPLLGVHYVLVLVLCVMALLLSVIILNFFHRDVRTDRLPDLLKVGLLDYGARFMLLKRHPYFQVDEEKPATDPSDGATNGATSQTAETTDDTRQFFKVVKQQAAHGSQLHRLVITEWHQAALVLDRLLFVLYLFIIIIASIAIYSQHATLNDVSELHL